MKTLPLALGAFLLAVIRPVVKSEGEVELLYLMKFGYMEHGDGETAAFTSPEDIKTQMKVAITNFQTFAGLKPTGRMDKQTKILMNTPRCGMKDIVGHGSYARKKRYVLQGSRWSKSNGIVTWKIYKYSPTSTLSKPRVRKAVKDALQLWENEISRIDFREHTGAGDADIKIYFEKGEHGDGEPFDGPGGTLAHAFFPRWGGDVHMDDTEKWTLGTHRGTDMFQTLVHELGHSLGLSHSDERSAIMAPFHKGYMPNLKLDKDDILAIQELYGAEEDPDHKPPSTARPNSRPNPRPRTGVCDLGGTPMDAITMTSDKRTYVFRGEEYWELDDEAIVDGYPRRISDDWEGLPGNIDTAVTWKDTGATYIFKGNQYWKFKNRMRKPGYPKQISEGFPGIPGDLDAAILAAANNKMYFFKGDDYWRFEPRKKPHVHKKYPKSIEKEWGGLPSELSSAFLWKNGKNYFFKGDDYWRFSERDFTIDSQGRRNVQKWWYGCASP